MNHKSRVGRKSFSCHYDLKKNEVPLCNKQEIILMAIRKKQQKQSKNVVALVFFPVLKSPEKAICYSPLGNLDRNLPDPRQNHTKEKVYFNTLL